MKKWFEKQILNKKFYNLSDFKIKTIRHVRFWFISITTLLILVWKNYNALDFESKTFQQVRFWKKLRIRKITFRFILLHENDILCIFRAFLKSMILYWNILYVSDFELKKIQRVRFWNNFFGLVRFSMKNSTTCQTLNSNFFNLKF